MTLPFSRLLSKQKGHTFGVISSDVVLLVCPLEDEWTMIFELSLIRSAIMQGILICQNIKIHNYFSIRSFTV